MATPVPLPAASGNLMFRALRHRDFRRFLGGQVISLCGTWMQNLAVSWLVYRLTHSTLLMGAVGFCTHLPVLILGPLAGITADRYSRYRIVLGTQFAFLLQSAVLAALTLAGYISVPSLLVLTAVWGVINAFDIPARQALYIHLVGPDDLLNAIALNSVTFNSARVVGPAIGGFLVAAFGEGLCFALNSASFLAVVGSLLSIRPKEPPRQPPLSPWIHLRQGLQYAWRNRTVRVLLGVTALANVATTPLIVLNPVFADAIFGRGSQGLGLLTGSLGLGAVVGTLRLARHTQTEALARVVLLSAFSGAAALVLYSVSRSFIASLAIIAFLGFSLFRQLASMNTLIQSAIEDEFRGRVMSLYSMTVVGMLPVGSLVAGAVAEWLGVRLTVFCGGLLSLVSALLWARESRATLGTS